MNSLWALGLLCLSPVENFGHVTIANRVPAVCAPLLGSPPLPVSVVPIAEMGFNDTEKALQAVPVKKATSAPKKAKKPPRRSRCKPGRTRNAAGICGRWR